MVDPPDLVSPNSGPKVVSKWSKMTPKRGEFRPYPSEIRTDPGEFHEYGVRNRPKWGEIGPFWGPK